MKKIHSFLHRYMCSGFIVMYLWSDQCEFMDLFMVFNLWIGPGFIFESCN